MRKSLGRAERTTDHFCMLATSSLCQKTKVSMIDTPATPALPSIEHVHLPAYWQDIPAVLVVTAIVVGLLLAVALVWLLQRLVVRKGPEVLRVLVSLGRSIKTALGGNVYVGRVARRYPAGSRFLVRRVDRSRFYGLALTLLVLAFAYVLALFAGIIEDVVTADSIVALDHAMAQLIAAYREPWVVAVFLWITSLGEPRVVGAVLVVACLVLWLTKRKYAIAGLLASSFGAGVFVTLGKLAFQRSRPVAAVLLEPSFSFPSGHATIAVAFYGFLGYVLIRSSTQWKQRVNLLFATATLVLAIGLSRIGLGVHYLSDVWAGYLLGALWLIVGITLSEWLSASGRIVWDGATTPCRRAAVFGLILAAIVGFIAYASTRSLPPSHGAGDDVAGFFAPAAHNQART